MNLHSLLVSDVFLAESSSLDGMINAFLLAFGAAGLPALLGLLALWLGRSRGAWAPLALFLGATSVVLAEMDTFAKRHRFVRHPEQEFSGNYYTLDHVTYLPMQERGYSFHFDPARKLPDGDVRLTLTHNGNEPCAELHINGHVDHHSADGSLRSNGCSLRLPLCGGRDGTAHRGAVWISVLRWTGRRSLPDGCAPKVSQVMVGQMPKNTVRARSSADMEVLG